jgi:uncharacterized membrane protein
VDDRLPRLESTIDEVRRTIQALERRIAALESAAGQATEAAADAESAAGEHAAVDAPAGARDWRDPVFIGTLLGRLVLVLGGAFFLRATTDRGAVPQELGVALGFVYSLVWLVLADRAGRRGLAPAAFFHAVAVALVAFPLV